MKKKHLIVFIIALLVSLYSIALALGVILLWLYILTFKWLISKW